MRQHKIMNIHILCNCFWGDGMSGGDRRILELMRRWHDTEQYHFIIYTPQKFHDIMIKENISHLSVCVVDKGKKNSSNVVVEYSRRSRYCLKKLKQNISAGDVIYSTTDFLTDVIPAVYFKRKNKLNIKWCLITQHMTEKFYKRQGNVISNFLSFYQQEYAFHLARKYADKHFTVSPIIMDYMKKHNFDMDKIELVGNGVDPKLVNESNLNSAGYDAVFLGRLIYSKGILDLPLIWKKVTDRLPNASLAIMGNGADKIVLELMNSIKDNGISSNIDVKGYVEAKQAYSIMKKSKIFLFTSYAEGWGIAPAEAMACGIPVVAYDLPIFRRLFPKGVFLCKTKNIDEMAEKACKLIENETYRKQQGNEGRSYVLEHYTWDAVAENELNILIQVG